MKEEEIKKFESFRKDDEGVYYYFDDPDGNNNWSYNLEHLEEYIVDLQQKLSTANNKLKKIEEYINNKSEINFECGKWVNTLEIEKIIKGDD